MNSGDGVGKKDERSDAASAASTASPHSRTSSSESQDATDAAGDSGDDIQEASAEETYEARSVRHALEELHDFQSTSDWVLQVSQILRYRSNVLESHHLSKFISVLCRQDTVLSSPLCHSLPLQYAHLYPVRVRLSVFASLPASVVRIQFRLRQHPTRPSIHLLHLFTISLFAGDGEGA